MSSLIAYASNNAAQIDIEDAIETLTKECPDMLQPNESLVLAFRQRGGKGRDDSFFTTHRLIFRDKTGMTGKKIKYLSIPYHSVKAYSVETAGSMDSDTELKVMYGEGKYIAMDFVAKSTDIMAIKRFLNDRVLTGQAIGAPVPGGGFASPEGSGGGNVLDWFGDNATQIDATVVETNLKSDPHNILLDDEKVELAFKCGRDSFLCTSKRLLKIDVQGVSAKRIEYLTLLWGCVRAFSVETAGGYFDRDSELVLYTTCVGIGRTILEGIFPAMSRLGVDFKKGKADIYAVQRFFSDKLLGVDTTDFSETLASMPPSPPSGSGGGGGGVSGFLAWMGDDNKMIDAKQVDEEYHSNPAILHPSEHVEMAFKGRRDLVLFTTKRLLIVDKQGRKGKKVEYATIPWTSVQLFSVKSAGSMDKDSELCIWTDVNDVWYPPKENEDSPPPPPVARKSYLEIDFAKDKVDLMSVHRYVSERVLRVEETGTYLSSDVPVSPDVLTTTSPDSVKTFLSYLGDDARAINPDELDEQMHGDCPILQGDEKVVLAYKSGRDTTVFTTKRVLRVDVHGMTGSKVEWQSVPYGSIRAFKVESAGSWDRDAEFKLYCNTFWVDGSPGSGIKQDLRKGKADVIAIQALLAAQIIGGQDGSSPSHFTPSDVNAGSGGTMDAFASWASGDASEISAEVVNKQLRENPPILQSDENVDLAFCIGRDMCIFTTKRIIFVDRQGFSGKKVEYMSYPLRYCDAFKVQSAGSIGFLSEAKLSVYTSIPGATKIEQELKKKGSDIWGIQTVLADKILNRD